MKWPITSTIENSQIRTFKVEFLTRINELNIHLDKCKTCKQCVKVCPHSALIMPVIPKGKKVNFQERMPIMPDLNKCVFCGVCMVFCPFEAISLVQNHQKIEKENLALIVNKKIPKIAQMKIGKFELVEQNSSTPFWEKIAKKIIS